MVEVEQVEDGQRNTTNMETVLRSIEVSVDPLSQNND